LREERRTKENHEKNKKNETVKKALLVVKALVAKPVERFKERVELLF
jgi:hypothetical protein